jgi:hypothetical protein
MDYTPYKKNLPLFTGGAIAGLFSILSYLSVVFFSFGASVSFVLVMAFSILGIISLYMLYHFLEVEVGGHSPRLSFYFGAFAFVTLAIFLSAQIAIGSGFEDEYIKGLSVEPDVARLVRRAVRLIDMGMDVAWDMFIGVSFLFIAASMRRHSKFGLIWAIPLAILALILISLNAATFPWPPADEGLFDVGPFCGVFIFAVNIRVLVFALKARKEI